LNLVITYFSINQTPTNASQNAIPMVANVNPMATTRTIVWQWQLVRQPIPLKTQSQWKRKSERRR